MADTNNDNRPASCPCFSGRAYADCCEPVVTGARDAATAEELMRGRYSAYAVGAVDFIIASTHPDRRAECDEKSIRAWSANSVWTGFEVLSAEGGQAAESEGAVEFVARFTENRVKKTLHETGTFKKSGGRWYYVDGTMHLHKPFVRGAEKLNRNAPCRCGSGKKYKKCCMDKDIAAESSLT
jgi:SEC-C motif-containing protein